MPDKIAGMMESVAAAGDILASVISGALIIWLIVRMVNDWPKLTKGRAFWMASGLIAVIAFWLILLMALVARL